ncbi:TonB-dependent receptor domain-containing protein [Beggiatoa leptomitoformis]|uniref:TonB-dependent receptor n=1 Tax=Beggiatoa leptomitoformis TaxID=288004 RepID=A0A2N9YJD1_9GAMM|nr:TonB-dependent receptor [Beggiatoa leptomitoformis]ALG69504.2 TonB-dependent receptor [Beggiatoa leptomitoformis]AUI70593.2 TonB-dependent receptor [Beggiatoa leptomitoformis]
MSISNILYPLFRRKFVNHRLAVVFPCLISLSFSCFATETVQPTVVVTATRTAQSIDESMASVTVIDRETIARSQALTVTDLLKGLAGVDVVTSGGLGQASSIFMRGAESDHVLVLIDGVKVGSATLGTTAFQYLPPSQIDHIEVVRGTRSALYGSEAIGGVIQIFTRQGSGEPHTQASLGMGNHNTYEATANHGGKIDKTTYSVAVDYLQSDGFNACNGSESRACYTVEPDADGYDNTSFSAQVSHQFSREFQAGVYTLRAEGNNQFDSMFANEIDFTQQVVGLKAQLAVTQAWDMSLNIGQSQDEQDNFGHETSSNNYQTKRNNANWQNNFSISDNQLFTLGYDYLEDKLDSTTEYASTTRQNNGVFGQYQMQWEAFNIIIGGRYDDNEQFGGQTTGNINLGYKINPTLQTFIAYGTAFKAPSFNELYYPYFGNPDLEPEEADSVEIGLQANEATYHWSLNLYRNQVKQLIATSYDASTDSYLPNNVDKASIQGIEADVGTTWGAWTATGNVTWLDHEDDATGNWLPRRARQSAKAALHYQFEQGRIGGEVLAQGSRYEDTANQRQVAGYGILNLNSEYSLSKQWMLRARLDNVLDREYELAQYYHTAGRGFFVSVHYSD